MKSLEEIVYEIAREALADQERRIAGTRLRTGTLVAAHALVASFLGSAALRESGLTVAAWGALAVLAAALALAAVVLWPWDVQFALPASRVYARVACPPATTEHDEGAWLLTVARLYEQAEQWNAPTLALTGRCSGGIALLLVAQTLFWLAGLG